VAIAVNIPSPYIPPDRDACGISTETQGREAGDVELSPHVPRGVGTLDFPKATLHSQYVLIYVCMWIQFAGSHSQVQLAFLHPFEARYAERRQRQGYNGIGTVVDRSDYVYGYSSLHLLQFDTARDEMH
jgi:hypothetical protein